MSTARRRLRDYKMQSLHIGREIGNPVQEGVAFSGIASVDLRPDCWAMARPHCEQAPVIHRATFNRFHEGITLGCFGEAYAGQAMLPEAIAAFAHGEAVLLRRRPRHQPRGANSRSCVGSCQ